jgi:hypothetical protein
MNSAGYSRFYTPPLQGPPPVTNTVAWSAPQPIPGQAVWSAPSSPNLPMTSASVEPPKNTLPEGMPVLVAAPPIPQETQPQAKDLANARSNQGLLKALFLSKLTRITLIGGLMMASVNKVPLAIAFGINAIFGLTEGGIMLAISKANNPVSRFIFKACQKIVGTKGENPDEMTFADLRKTLLPISLVAGACFTVLGILFAKKGLPLLQKHVLKNMHIPIPRFEAKTLADKMAGVKKEFNAFIQHTFQRNWLKPATDQPQEWKSLPYFLEHAWKANLKLGNIAQVLQHYWLLFYLLIDASRETAYCLAELKGAQALLAPHPSEPQKKQA